MTENANTGIVRVALGSDPYCTAALSVLQRAKIDAACFADTEALVAFAPSVVVADAALLDDAALQQIRGALPDVAILGDPAVRLDVEFPRPEKPDSPQLMQLLRSGCELQAARQSARQSKAVLSSTEAHFHRLVDASVSLSAEKDLGRLLRRILETAQEIACCDAASLFLLDDKGEQAELVFKLTLNDSLDVGFREARFPVDTNSVAGYVATYSAEVLCDDVYALTDESPYRFNTAFDQQSGYRTCSLFAVPMLDYNDRAVGVLQFINRKRDRATKLTDLATTEREVIGFDDTLIATLRAFASLSASAIQTRVLIDSINNLFENFVHASVAAIEQRDPTTSGHSFRVADLAVALATALPQSNRSDLSAFRPSDEILRELKYASLLHDFGKVGVREHVLIKPKKLYDWQLRELQYRVELARQQVRNRAGEQLLALYERNRYSDETVAAIRQSLEAELSRLDAYLEAIQTANEPSVLQQDCLAELTELTEYQLAGLAGDQEPLLAQDAFVALSIPRGSLTDEERREIESHVVHTYNFLKLIPWTGELANVPDIARYHHEKLNGVGYPDHLQAVDIPLQSRVMTICDIYDALTASDRPYKPAVPEAVAFRILREDAERGMLDNDMVELFIGAGVAEVIRNKSYPKITPTHIHTLQRGVCDLDLEHDH